VRRALDDDLEVVVARNDRRAVGGRGRPLEAAVATDVVARHDAVDAAGERREPGKDGEVGARAQWHEWSVPGRSRTITVLLIAPVR